MNVNLVRNFTNSATAADIYTGQTLLIFDNGQNLLAGLGTCAGGVKPGPGAACTQIAIGAGATNQYGPITVNNTDDVYGLAQERVCKACLV